MTHLPPRQPPYRHLAIVTIASDSPSRLGTEQPAHSSQLDQLKQAVKSAGHLLPVQGPITAFVFLNHLEALEDLPFDTAVQKGGDSTRNGLVSVGIGR